MALAHLQELPQNPQDKIEELDISANNLAMKTYRLTTSSLRRGEEEDEDVEQVDMVYIGLVAPCVP